jgi:hypothetical protein
VPNGKNVEQDRSSYHLKYIKPLQQGDPGHGRHHFHFHASIVFVSSRRARKSECQDVLLRAGEKLLGSWKSN